MPWLYQGNTGLTTATLTLFHHSHLVLIMAPVVTKAALDSWHPKLTAVTRVPPQPLLVYYVHPGLVCPTCAYHSRPAITTTTLPQRGHLSEQRVDMVCQNDYSEPRVAIMRPGWPWWSQGGWLCCELKIDMVSSGFLWWGQGDRDEPRVAVVNQRWPWWAKGVCGQHRLDLVKQWFPWWVTLKPWWVVRPRWPWWAKSGHGELMEPRVFILLNFFIESCVNNFKYQHFNNSTPTLFVKK